MIRVGSMPSLAVLDNGTPVDLFDAVQIADGVARVRTPFLFEIGEQLHVRVEDNGKTYDTHATVRAHTGPADARVTELVLEAR